MPTTDVVRLVVDNGSVFLVITVVAGLLGGLRATFPTNGSAPTLYMAVRQIVASVALSLFYFLAVVVDRANPPPIIPFPAMVNLVIIGLISLWALDILMWLVGFGKEVRENGPMGAFTKLNPFSKKS